MLPLTENIQAGIVASPVLRGPWLVVGENGGKPLPRSVQKTKTCALASDAFLKAWSPLLMCIGKLLQAKTEAQSQKKRVDWEAIGKVGFVKLEKVRLQNGGSRCWPTMFTVWTSELWWKQCTGVVPPPPPLCVLRQDPLEAILVIFGRRALICFLFESSWKNMKNETTFVRMRSGDLLGDAKMAKKARRSVEFNFLTNCDRQKRFFAERKTKGRSTKRYLKILILLQDLVLAFQSLVMILPNFFDIKRL